MWENRNHIDYLPYEVLCMIFDHLKLRHVKNASLTCRRWNDIIFDSDYIDRFKLNMSVVHNSFLRRPRQLPLTRLLTLGKRVVKHTERPYRKLSFDIEPLITGQFQSFWKFIHPKITQNLRVLTFYFIEGSMRDIFPFIIDAIPSMTQLQSLTVTGCCSLSYSPQIIPTIRSQSIQHLVMECKYKYTIDMPQLHTFKGALNALEASDKNSPPTVFSNLRHLTILVKGWKSTDLSLFGRMPCLETLDWGVIFPDLLFTALRKTCPSLIELRIPKNLYLLDMVILTPLFEVAQLRRLFLRNIVMHRLVDPVLDFSKLTQLEELDLGKTVVQPHHLRKLPKSIRKLGLHLDPWDDFGYIVMRLGTMYERKLIDFITSNLSQLTELRLEYDRNPPSQHVLKSLPLLEHLEVLEFSHSMFKQSFFHEMMDAPLHRLHTLRFVECSLETKDFRGLNAKFPTLNRRKFLKCSIIDEPKDRSDSELDELESNADADPAGDGYDCDEDQSDNELDDSMENEPIADANTAGDAYNDCYGNKSGNELYDSKTITDTFDNCAANKSESELDDSMESEWDDSMDIESCSDSDISGSAYGENDFYEDEYDENDYLEYDKYDAYDFIESALFLDSATMES